MTGMQKKTCSQPQERKTKSGLSTLKKKLNIPKIYKRLASKLSVHGRQIRMLTSSWNSNDLKALISEYELTGTLKELSDAADLARPPASNIVKDLDKLQKSGFLCGLKISASCKQCHNVHAALFSKRSGISMGEKGSSTDNHSKDSYVVESSFPSKVDSKVKFLYNPCTKTLSVESKHPLSHGYIEKWLAHIYGQSSWKKITNKRTLSQVVEKIKDIPEVTNPNEEKNFWSSLSENLSLASSDRTDEGDLFTHDFFMDLRDLWFSSNLTGDVKLVFTVPSPSSRFLSKPTGFSCHSFVLAARSTFFRTALSKYRESLEEFDPSGQKSFVTIEVDWKAFSPRYVQVVFYAMYTDQVDLQHIVKDFCIPVGHNHSQIEAVSDDVKDLTELLYLGKFLDFPMLVQGCENSLSQILNVSNIESLLRWSSQPHGSVWLRRQIIRYIRDNFLQLSLSGVLNSLTCEEMSEVIKSDFVNSPELDILRSVLKWGEGELFRRIELREPNLVRSHVILSQANRSFRSSTSQSLSSRRRDILLASNTEELHECTSALLTHVRLRHVLPANHEVLTSAIKRGVISCPPEHLLEWHHHAGVSTQNENTFFWLREKAGLGFLPPRLFLPHVEEAKGILEERLCSESTGNVNLRSVRKTSNQSCPTPAIVPDALYMVGQLRNATYTHTASCDKCRRHRIGVTSLATRRLKYIDGSYPVPKPSIAVLLLARERTLRQTAWLKRVLQLCHAASTSLPHCCCRSERNSFVEVDGALPPGIFCNLCRAERYLRLLVVREHGLPDVASDLLRRPHLYYDPDEMAESPPLPPTDPRIPEVATSTSGAPRKLQKLFQKRSAPRKSCAVPENLDITKTWEGRHQVLSSGSEQSLSDGSVDWHFPYNGVDKKGCGVPGSSFWGSDSSIASLQKLTSVPDVAASAHSTIRSNNSRFSSSSSESSRHGDNVEDSDLTTHGSITRMRRTPLSSYSQYLSLNRRRSESSGPHQEATLNLTGISASNPRNRGLPQLVLDGTSRRSESPDIFPDALNSLERDSPNHSVAADHVTRTNVSKETCL